ncbi:type III polyketide synthase [Belliella sp. DSM 107340]|uniref:Type III polyketide synthase n=1 Tax=Belliella calami TaxID=2923436 RepID=A0ABS9UKY6_9BACT|nr:type III polyketide synthase [Belliella calami]MCH7397289.1 type III polyketide synthase [Belliella calami]
MDNYILSIGTANPGSPIPQQQISKFMQQAHQLDESESRKLKFVYRHSGIDSRHSVLNDFRYENPEEFTFFPKNSELEPFPSTKDRMKVFQETAMELGKEAIGNCLNKSSLKTKDITHLILVSCTGMYAPGLEIDLIHEMGFLSTVERYSIHFMGCYAAFNAIKLADRICDSDHQANVLILSVELCTIHFQKTYTEDNLIANAIFADGAAAVLISKNGRGLKIKNYGSQIVKEGANDMAWSIGDFGFEMKLSKYVPELLSQGIHKLMSYLESKHQLSSISHFAVHPGGKQILQKVEEAFKISSDQNIYSHKILQEKGNMSSATIIFVLEKWLEDQEKSGDILAMGFGPGLTLETLLLEK